MAMLRLHLLVWVVLLASNDFIEGTMAKKIRNQVVCNSLQERQIAFFVFGDSLFDVGNGNYLKNPLANRFPYGQTFFNHPTGRATNGRTIADFIAQYLNLPVIQPYLQPGYQRLTDGVDFANAAGALVETFQGMGIDFQTQLRYFKNVEKKLKQSIGATKTRLLLNEALFLFSIGGNDYTGPLTMGSTILQSFAKEDYVGMVIGNITLVLKDIYRHGERRFGFLNLMPLGCTPIIRAIQNITGDGCSEEVNVYVNMHNKALPIALRKLQTQLDGFEYSIFDMYTTLGERMRNPSKYGFKVGMDMACCGSGLHRGKLNCGKENYEVCEHPNEHVFFYSVHPTERTNFQLAQLMWNGSRNVSTPVNLKSLLHF